MADDREWSCERVQVPYTCFIVGLPLTSLIMFSFEAQTSDSEYLLYVTLYPLMRVRCNYGWVGQGALIIVIYKLMLPLTLKQGYF